MADENPDMALHALILSSRESDSDLPEDLIEKAYKIQRNYQFDRDRTLSFQAMEKLIDEYVNLLANKAEAGDK